MDLKPHPDFLCEEAETALVLSDDASFDLRLFIEQHLGLHILAATDYPIFAHCLVSKGYIPQAERLDPQLFAAIMQSANVSWPMANCSDETLMDYVHAVHSLFVEEGLSYANGENAWVHQLTIDPDTLLRKVNKMALLLSAVASDIACISADEFTKVLLQFVSKMQDNNYIFYPKHPG